MSNDDRFSILVLTAGDECGSYNHALVDGARRTAPVNVEIIDFDLLSVPLYDGDLGATGDAEVVRMLKQIVREADALLIFTPECDSEVPCVVKNGIDWISQTYPDAPIRGKITAVIAATPGRSGPRMAQAELRQILDRAGAIVISEPHAMTT